MQREKPDQSFSNYQFSTAPTLMEKFCLSILFSLKEYSRICNLYLLRYAHADIRH